MRAALRPAAESVRAFDALAGFVPAGPGGGPKPDRLFHLHYRFADHRLQPLGFPGNRDGKR
jgi:hypothetical protein